MTKAKNSPNADLVRELSKEGWRVVYGETRPTWERIFPTKRKAEVFAKKHRSFGDAIFSIAKTVPGEPPQSMTAAIMADEVRRARSSP